MTLYNAYQTLSPNTQLIAAACLHKACVVLKQQSPSLSSNHHSFNHSWLALSDVSLCSYTDQDLVGIEEKMESPSIPLLYSTLCDIHHSIQSSSLLIFASFVILLFFFHIVLLRVFIDSRWFEWHFHSSILSALHSSSSWTCRSFINNRMGNESCSSRAYSFSTILSYSESL